MNGETLETLLNKPETTVESNSEPIQHATELKLDQWSLRQGEDLLQESFKLQQWALTSTEVADLYGIAFLPLPEFHAQSQDPIRRQFMEQLTESQEFRVLKDGTKLNLIASQIAATAFGCELQALKIRLQHPSSITKNGKTGNVPYIASTSKAARIASKEIGDFAEVCEAFGLGVGGPCEPLDTKDLSLLFKQFQSNPLIRSISHLAGCYKQVAKGCHTISGNGGLDDFSGFILGCELSRVLPPELLRIALPELEMDFLRRFAEGQLMIRDFESNDPAGLGPIVVVVDESGSMQGSKIEHAKAIGLVFAWLARCQGRWCGLVSFSGGTGHYVLGLSPDTSKTSELLQWASSFIGGGSDQDLPVSEMPAIFEEINGPEGKTDLVYISDAQLKISAKHAEAFLKWKVSVNAKLTSLVIGTEPGDLATISDKVHLFEMLSPELVKAEQIYSN